MIKVDSVGIKFGGVTALQDVSFEIEEGEIVGVIGPNGSGKSTLINVITGFYKPSSGNIFLNSEKISELQPQSIRHRGIVRTFQNLRLVQEMTVLENCLAGLYPMFVNKNGPVISTLAALFKFPNARETAKKAESYAREALQRVELDHRIDDRVSELSYAEQKRLEIARSIAMKPQYLILDEPTAGMGVEEADYLIHMIVKLAKSTDNPMALLLVEHRLELVLETSDRVIVMDGGRLIADGSSAEVGNSKEVRQIYVGGE